MTKVRSSSRRGPRSAPSTFARAPSNVERHFRRVTGDYQLRLISTAMPKTSLVWKADNVFNTAFSAGVANVTYYVASETYGHAAYLQVHSPRGGLKRLDLGLYAKIEQAKQACERHYAAGCDLSKAKKVTR
jgi:hypothetical protein